MKGFGPTKKSRDRLPNYARTGLLYTKSNPAGEELSTLPKNNSDKPSLLSKVVPSPHVITAKAVETMIVNSDRILQYQEKKYGIVGGDNVNDRYDIELHEAVCLLPTRYLEGLLEWERMYKIPLLYHYLTQQSVCDGTGMPPSAAFEKWLPTFAPPSPCSGDREGPDAVATVFHDQLGEMRRVLSGRPAQGVTSSPPSFPSFNRVELPIELLQEDIDNAEEHRLPKDKSADDDDVSDELLRGTKKPRDTTRWMNNTRIRHRGVRLTKRILVVVCRNGEPIEGIPHIVALELVGTKLYSSDDVTDDRDLDAKYTFSFRPFPKRVVTELSIPDSEAVEFPTSSLEDLLKPTSHDTDKGKTKSVTTINTSSLCLFGRDSENVDVVLDHPTCSSQHFVMWWVISRQPKGQKQAVCIPPVTMNTNGSAEGCPVPTTDASDFTWFIELQVADLSSVNGTRVNGSPICGDVRIVSSVEGTSEPSSGGMLPPSRPFVQSGVHKDLSQPAQGSTALVEGDVITVGGSSKEYIIVYDNDGIVERL
eukprot:Tbor_TRINITY_DN4617_c0_g1::TRINITY_DN4617_c0_g1_i1::g.14796::m.14796